MSMDVHGCAWTFSIVHGPCVFVLAVRDILDHFCRYTFIVSVVDPPALVPVREMPHTKRCRGYMAVDEEGRNAPAIPGVEIYSIVSEVLPIFLGLLPQSLPQAENYLSWILILRLPSSLLSLECGKRINFVRPRPILQYSNIGHTSVALKG